MKKITFPILCIIFLSTFLITNIWAVDETAIQELQTDVSSTKSKAEQNAADIQNMKGGLPAEAAARQAADEELRSLINKLLNLLGKQCVGQGVVIGIDENGNLICDSVPVPVDADEDGFISADTGGTDCDDSNPNIYPGAVEFCDGLDNDCNELVDDKDFDGDGYIDANCGGADCDDSNNFVNPGVDELCTDELDNNCDGTVNEGCSPSSSVVLTGSGAFIIPIGVTVITVELWGGGGGGGGASDYFPLVYPSNGGGGGGSGGYTSQVVSVIPGQEYNYSIGEAGIGGSGGGSSAGHGSPGGNSSFTGNGLSLTAGGGQGGLGGQMSEGPGSGGAGGSGYTQNGNSGSNGLVCEGGDGGSPVPSFIDSFTYGGSGGQGGGGGSNCQFPQSGQSGTNGFGLVRW